MKHLPLTVWLLGAVAFVMGTTELIIARILPQLSAAFDVSESKTGLLITIFAIGMLVGAPVMALATLKLPRKRTLLMALAVFAAAHIVSALTMKSPSQWPN